MIKKSPNLVNPIQRRNNEIRDEEIDNDDGIIYPPGYSVATASPISMNDPNSLPLAPAVFIENHNTHNAEEGRVSSTQNSEESHSKKTDSRFDPFRPIHPQCNHISYGCLTMVFLVFVGIAVLLKTYLPDILPPSNDNNGVIPSIDDEDLKLYDSYQPSPHPSITKYEESTEPYPSPSFLPTVTRSNSPSMYLSPTPSITRYEEKKLVASDGSDDDLFGTTCSMVNDLVVIGATGVDEDKGAAYLFNLDGTQMKKLTPANEGNDYHWFGVSVAIDEKVVVGSTSSFSYVEVFSRLGIYERTIRCDDCTNFGRNVATLGNLIVVDGYQNSTHKLFIYSTEEGRLLKTLEQEGGNEVAVSADRVVIGDRYTNSLDGAARLYKTDGTLVKSLDRQDASSDSYFGNIVAITDDKVFVGARRDDDQGTRSGSVFIYSAVTGEFLEKIVAPDGEAEDYFGMSVCASDSSFVVGATGDDDNGSSSGSAYLFQLSE